MGQCTEDLKRIDGSLIGPETKSHMNTFHYLLLLFIL